MKKVNAVIVGNCAYDVNTFFNRDGIDKKVITNRGGACLYSAIPGSIFNRIGIVTRVGSDFDYDLFKRLNIDDEGIIKVDGKSNKFIHTYLSEDGQTRTFEGDVNEDCMIKVDDIPDSYLEADYIHVCTNFPDIQLETVKYLKKHSKAKISIDTHEAYVDDPKVLESFNLVDIAFIDKEYKNLHNCEAPVKIFKMGKSGCKYVSEEKEFVVGAPICDFVVDKTGAGDCVTGVYLALKSLGKTDEEALEVACRAATESIKDYGVEHLLDKKLN